MVLVSAPAVVVRGLALGLFDLGVGRCTNLDDVDLDDLSSGHLRNLPTPTARWAFLHGDIRDPATCAAAGISPGPSATLWATIVRAAWISSC